MDQKTIKKELDWFVSRTTKNLPVRKIILFGSFAKKTALTSSDIDLLVLGDFKQNNISDPTGALYDFYSDLQSKHPMHVIGMNIEDFLTRNDSLTLASIQKTGKVVYTSREDQK